MRTELTWFKSSHSNDDGGNCVEVALSWFKSSHSNTDGGACIEVALSWHKSSHSNSEGGNCVEVAACPHTVHVRDSKDRTVTGLAFPADAWAAFLPHTSP